MASASALSAAAPVSETSQPSLTASGGSFAPAITGDKAFVLFVSHAGNLTTNNSSSQVFNIFRRNLTTKTTTLISVGLQGVESGNGNSTGASMSDNGRFIAFESEANNLTDADANGTTDVFVHDAGIGRTVMASISPDANAGGNGRSSSPVISSDGRWLAFQSAASDLVTGDTNGWQDIFLRDLIAENTVLISANAVEAGPAQGAAESLWMTPDGVSIAFVHRATNNVAGRNSRGEVYAWDRLTGETRWASRNVQQLTITSSGYVCSEPVMSADGKTVFFKVQFDSLPNTFLFRSWLATGTLSLLATNVYAGHDIAVRANGQLAVYDSPLGIHVWDAEQFTNILVEANVPGLRRSTHPALARSLDRVTFITYESSVGRTSVRAVDWRTGLNTLVSATQDGTQPADAADVGAPVISDDGSIILYESADPAIVSDDFNNATDVFARSLPDERTILISQRSDGNPGSTPSVASIGSLAAISSDGRFIAYQRYDLPALAPADTNGYSDVWVRDLDTGGHYFTGAGRYGTRDPVLSANGRYVVFLSGNFYFPSSLDTPALHRLDLVTGEKSAIASNPSFYSTLVGSALAPAIGMSGDGNQVAYSAGGAVWVHDVISGRNQLISSNRFGTGNGNQISSLIGFRPDGQWLLFGSSATDLTPEATGGLFACDLARYTTRLLTSNYRPGRRPPMAAFSPDSKFLAYVTATNSIEILNVDDNTTGEVCVGCLNPSVADGGQWVVYETVAAGGVPSQVYLHNRAAGTNRLISSGRVGPFGGNGGLASAQISYDARFIVFSSRAEDLVEGDDNNASDVFVYDRLRQKTLLLSINRQGNRSGNGSSIQPMLASDGRTVVFTSLASDLTQGDYNDTLDVFVARLHGPDTDTDGLDDDWEMAYFDTLSRDGTGDLDGDGVSDRDEFLAGTVPSNSQSKFQVLTVRAMAGTAVTVMWSAAPGRAYQVQYKESVDDLQWRELPGIITASGSTAWSRDEAALSSQRFYRVLQVR